MPHKRAKLSVRKETSKNIDLPPTGDLNLSKEDTPKSFLRVVKAEQVRKLFREKRAREEDGSTSKENSKRQKKEGGSQPLTIKQNESLKQFNKRVEEEMRTQVAEAMQTSRSVSRKVGKEERRAKLARISAAQGKTKSQETEDHRESNDSEKKRPAAAVEFAKAEQRRSLHDVVQEPPTLTKLPRGSKLKPTGGSKQGVVSIAQSHMMELERERTVQRYRELKERRLAQKEA